MLSTAARNLMSRGTALTIGLLVAVASVRCVLSVRAIAADSTPTRDESVGEVIDSIGRGL